MVESYDIQQILETMPHRYPFLLVDRILELVPAEKVVALKNVTINEPFFQGHFPGAPIMPGVLIVEGMGQAGGMLAFSTFPQKKKGSPIYFMGFDRVRFRRPVFPGDQLIYELDDLRTKMNALKMRGRATVNNEIVAEAQLLATFGDHS
jgi:3-hydroxyacyl-[acyl-carrier-protein] dehydratase